MAEIQVTSEEIKAAQGRKCEFCSPDHPATHLFKSIDRVTKTEYARSYCWNGVEDARYDSMLHGMPYKVVSLSSSAVMA